MSAERSIATQERLLAQMPVEYQNLAEWCWSSIRPALVRRCLELGLDRRTAQTTASRVARMVGTQVLTDVRQYRLVSARPGATR